MTIRKSETVGCREDLAQLCNEMRLVTAAEVGTDRGVFARDFLERWRGEMLYCVDPYEPYPQMPWDRSGDLMMAATLLSAFAPRCRIVRTRSLEAAKILGALHFVYIDASHEYEEVAADIGAWWTSVRQGGILAGDDYDREHPGVMRAVNEFFDLRKTDLWLTTDYNRPPSWFVIKT